MGNSIYQYIIYYEFTIITINYLGNILVTAGRESKLKLWTRPKPGDEWINEILYNSQDSFEFASWSQNSFSDLSDISKENISQVKSQSSLTLWYSPLE